MGLLNLKITQGGYWGGPQIPYWLYMVFVIFPVTGILGVDHLLLRSPITAILKALSFVPLFGFWYFYDIAQLGEGDLIKKNGIGIPFYGPLGIGAGIFVESGKPQSPKEKPRPWLFVAYALTSMMFLAFPINKLVIGDYIGALAQLCMLIVFPLALAWSIYDIYRIVFDIDDVFKKGAARIPPASWLLGGYVESYLGPTPAGIDTGIGEIIVGAIEAPIVAAGKGAAGVVDAAAGTVESGLGAVSEAADAAKEIATAAKGAAGAVKAISTISAVPNALNTAIQKAGGTTISNIPSSMTMAVLFGVALLAFSGYAFNALQKIGKVNSDKDDPPPNPDTARRNASTEK